MLTTFGLCLIVLGWIYQLIFLLKGDKKIKPPRSGLELNLQGVSDGF